MTTPNDEALQSQFDQQQSGVIYTPPTYSDHVAVVCHLEFPTDCSAADLNKKIQPLKDKATKECQPHKAQQSLSGFFMPLKGNTATQSTSDRFVSSKIPPKSQKSSKSKSPAKKKTNSGIKGLLKSKGGTEQGVKSNLFATTSLKKRRSCETSETKTEASPKKKKKNFFDLT